MQKVFTLSIFLLSGFQMALAGDQAVANALMEGNKINSVLVILSIILLGIIAFLIAQERKIKRLEDNTKP
jgi:CcmD family protein